MSIKHAVLLAILCALPACGRAHPVVNTFSFIINGAGVPDTGRSGYIITASTGIYRITWANGGNDHEYSGSIFSDPGQFGRFYPGCMDGSCALASGEDRVVLGSGDPDRIDFDSFPVSGKRSGFDVEVRNGRLTLDLTVDNLRDPSRVVFISDAGLSSAPGMPFGLQIR